MSRSTEELETLLWLKRPTAKENYLINPSLQERFKTYDEYSRFCYLNCKEQWKIGATYTSGNHTEIKTQSRESIISDSGFKTNREAEYKEQFRQERKEFIESIEIADKIVARNKFNGKVKKLKTGKSKKRFGMRRIATTCPCCMSTLKTNEVGVLECSGDRLKLWEKEFLTFNKLTEDQKGKYLYNFSNMNMFIELYEKWSYIDENGRHPLFECGYSNRLVNPISRFRTIFPDPILVKKIEKSFGRKLEEKELLGEKEIWREGNTFFSDFKKGRIRQKISFVVFPDGVL